MLRSTRSIPLALAVAIAACDTAAGPEAADPFDAQSVSADYAAVEAILSTAAWDGLSVLSRAGASAGPSAGPAAAPIISDMSRGSTYVYDADSADWVVDPDREGAPADGVRFIVYDEVAGVPDPSSERGWADLIDEGDGSAEDVALRLRVQVDGRLAMDYQVRADEEAGAGRVEVMGFVEGDDGERLDFDVALEGDGQGSNALDFDLSVESRDFAVEGSAMGDDATDDGSVRLAARHRLHGLDLDLESMNGSMSGFINLDSRPFVQVSGSSADPEFTRPDGTPLRPIGVIALLHVVDFVEDVFDLVEDVVDPVGDIVGLGWAL
ncbi:hypothetical protein V3331_00245 [Gaopeijia maritima]|uniref:hypothetical protein n=1 Tax=Gaopeijia maritima TaxID=3119007 RepID=UPI003249A7B2